MAENRKSSKWKWIYAGAIALVAILLFRYLKSEPSLHSESRSIVTEDFSNGESTTTVENSKTEEPEDSFPQYLQDKKDSTMSEEKNLSPVDIENLRSQAKSHLAALYAAQKSFYAEHKRYTTDLELIGWQPMTADLNFKMGFLTFNTPAKLAFNEDGTRMTTDIFLPHNEYESNQPIHYTALAESIDLQKYEYLCKEKCTADKNGFEALVVVPLGNSRQMDVWIINHKKEIIHILDGLKVIPGS